MVVGICLTAIAFLSPARSLSASDRTYEFLLVTGPHSWEPSINNSGEIVYLAFDEEGYVNVFSTLRGQLTHSRSQGVTSPSINDTGEVVYIDRHASSGRSQVVSTVRGVYFSDREAQVVALSDSGEICFLQSAGHEMILGTDLRSELVRFRGNHTTRCDLNAAGEVVYRDRDHGGDFQIFSSARGQLTTVGPDNSHVMTTSINNVGEVALIDSGAIYLAPDRLIARFDEPIGSPLDMNDHGDIVFPLLLERGFQIVVATETPDRYLALTPLQTSPIAASGVEVSVVVNPFLGSKWIDPNQGGPLVLAILTTQTGSAEGGSFDASKIDPLSVTLIPSGATIVVRSMSTLQDVNSDRNLDLVLYFRRGNSGIKCGDVELALEGKAEGGVQFSGSAEIATPECTN